MSLSEDYASMEDLHPIDIVESLAEHHAWEFDRVTDDQIARWQRVVDLLVVAGDSRVADLAD